MSAMWSSRALASQARAQLGSGPGSDIARSSQSDSDDTMLRSGQNLVRGNRADHLKPSLEEIAASSTW